MSTTPLNLPPSLDDNTDAQTSKDASSSLPPPTSSTSSTSLPSFPPEIIHHIIRFALPPLSVTTYRERYNTLLTLSLVSSTWRTFAQRELMRHIFVTPNEDSEELSQHLQDHPGQKGAVESLLMCLGDYHDYNPLELACERYTCLPRLQKLDLIAGSYIVHELCQLPPLGPNLKVLSITSFSSLRLPITEVNLPHLQTLALRDAGRVPSLLVMLQSFNLPELKTLILTPCLDFTRDEARQVADAIQTQLLSASRRPLDSLALVDYDDYTTSLVRPFLEEDMQRLQPLRRLTIGILDPIDVLHLKNCSTVQELRIHSSFEYPTDDIPLSKVCRFIRESTSTWKSLKVLELAKLSIEQQWKLENHDEEFRNDYEELIMSSQARGIEIKFDETMPANSYDAGWEHLLLNA